MWAFFYFILSQLPPWHLGVFFFFFLSLYLFYQCNSQVVFIGYFILLGCSCLVSASERRQKQPRCWCGNSLCLNALSPEHRTVHLCGFELPHCLCGWSSFNFNSWWQQLPILTCDSLFIYYLFISIISSCRWCTEKTPCAKEIRRANSWQLGGVYFPGQNSLRRVKLCEVILCGQMSPFRLSVHVLLAWLRGWKWTGVVQHTLLRLLLLDAAGEQPDQPTPDTEERKHQQSIVIRMTHHRGSRENEKAQTRSGFVFVFGLGATAADVWCTSCGPFFF